MASRKNSKNGRKSSSKRARSEKKRKSHKKWHQKGCQSGCQSGGGLGGGLTGGGAPWSASATQHQTAGAGAGAGVGAGAGAPNHYTLNSAISSPAQSSNHLMEKGFLGGSRRRRENSRRGRNHKSKHRRYIGEQRGGYAEYLPELANATVRGAVEVPSNMFNSIQGASTAFRTSNPVVQPIGQPIQLV